MWAISFHPLTVPDVIFYLRDERLIRSQLWPHNLRPAITQAIVMIMTLSWDLFVGLAAGLQKVAAEFGNHA